MEEDKLIQLPNEWENINGYQLIALMSSGAMGKTYKCSKSGSLYALKMIGLESSKQAKRQITILQKLKETPSIVKIVDSFEYRKNFCFVTEFCEGDSLINFIRAQPQKKIQQKEALVIFRYILSSLLEMHKLNILHRNIKAENIIMTSSGIPKICGFGLSRELDADSMTWSLCGTPTYLPPEILLGQPYNYKADIWSLGVLLFAMTTGQLPFGSQSSKKAQYQKVKQICIPYFSLENVKKYLKYPEKLDFGDATKEWESLFREFFQERPSKRLDYTQLLQHSLISPLLTDLSKLDAMLSSQQFQNSEDDHLQDQLSEQSEMQCDEEAMENMLQSKLLAGTLKFVEGEFKEQIAIYHIEMSRYLIVVDSYTYLRKGYMQQQTLSGKDRILMYYFLIQQIVFQLEWLSRVLKKRINQFKVNEFEMFVRSVSYEEICAQVERENKYWQQEFENIYNKVKEEQADETLPKEVRAGVISYIFIDFNSLEYLDMPNLYKLPFRAVLLHCFQKIYLKAKAYLSFTENVKDLMTKVQNDRDMKRQCSIIQACSYMRYALRILVCALLNRILSNHVPLLPQFPSIRDKKFELNSFLNALTLATLRQSTSTITDLFKLYFPQFDLANIEKIKFL